MVGLTGAQSATLATITVINTNDVGAGSLREAIENANSTAGLDTIAFSIGSGLQTIQPLSALPAITDPVIIDGFSQGGSSYSGPPLIELDGSLAGPGINGLAVTAGGSTIRGLIINRFGPNENVGTAGINLSGSGGNVVEGNFIGTNANGTAARGNRAGVYVASTDNTIGGTTAAARNVISGNTGPNGAGVWLVSSGSNNLVQGNYIGTDATGTLAIGNANAGVIVVTGGHTIGGTTTGARNVISGNLGSAGVMIQGGASTVQGNYIGLDHTGVAALPNGGYGVEVRADGSTIGGTVAGARNVISGNPSDGILTWQTTTGTTIQGNLIGTNAIGTAALANGGNGIAIGGVGHTIGGSEAGRNVISGNSGSGILMAGSGTSSNLVDNNYIGLNAAGTATLRNTLYGVRIYGTGANTVSGNAIAGNAGGVVIGTSGVTTAGQVVDSNTMGTDGSGSTVLGQLGAGVVISNSSNNSIVSNTIAGHTDVGILVDPFGGTAIGNSIRFNRIFDNNGIGIDLDPRGVTPNDIDDPDTGTNNLQNFPVLTSASGTTIAGSLNSTPGTTFQLDFFSNTAVCDFREGATYLGTASSVTTDVNGDATFSHEVGTVLASGTHVTATATTGGNTSEFSACRTVASGSADLTVESIALTAPAPFPQPHSYTVTVRNAGTATANVSGAVVQGYYSADTALDGGDSSACGTTMSGTIAAGATMDVPVGCSGAPGAGHNYLLVHVDQNNVVPESDDTNNVGSVALDAGGGSLAGSLSTTGGSVNLTTVGTQDWAIWGFAGEGTSTSLAPDVRKTGTTAISALTDIQPTAAPLRGLGQFPAENPFLFTWTNGSGPTSQTAATAGLQHDGQPTPPGTLNDGFSFTVPADTTSRTLRVYVSAHWGTGRLRATLSDVSAPAYVDSGVVGSRSPDGGNAPGVYTITYAAASAGQTLTVEWIESVADDPNFGTDNVAIYAVALAGPGVGGAADPPVLFGAVPNAVGATLGVAGVWDSGSPEPGQNFDVSFYSVPTCSPSATKTPLGSASELVTNNGGIGAFAIDGLTNVPVGTLVTATVSAGGTSGISNCVVADRNNTSWPTAFELAADDTDNNGRLRSSGQGRWFKVPILPNSRIDVNLSNLPADYDLVVFKDIQAKYDELVGGAAPEVGPNLALDDLNRQGADTPVDLFNTSQYNPSSWDPTNWKPDLNTSVYSPTEYSPTEYSPTEYSASFTSPTEYSPTEYSPTEYSPTEYSPTEYSPTEYSAEQFSRDEWATFNPADPRAFSAAQTASLVAVSAGAGTGDESVSVNTWNNTGFFYIRVQGKNGSFDPGNAFSVEVSRQGNLCSGVLDQASSPTATAGPYETLILVNSNRLDLTSISAKLNTLAAHAQVDGVVVDVHSDLVVRSLNAQADNRPGCPFAKNLVASAIKRIVDAYRDANPTLKYVVVVGDDNVTPFFRYPDPALLGNERLYVPPVNDNTASQASLRLGYVLSDDFLASSTSVSIHGNAFPVPDLAIGRLVETPAEIGGMLDAYIGANGAVSPTSSLVTGYDFLTDAADQVSAVLAPKIPGSNDETLITNQSVSPGTVTVGDTPDRTHSWTAADLRRELLNQRHDVIFLAGHFSANDALAADYKTNVLSTELPGATADLTNAIVFSAGCHAGYNIVNDHATIWTEKLDWAQAFAQKKATLIAGTGYQYGDTDFLAHSERIYAEFARQLGGPVGSSLLRSKQIFLEESPGLSALDEKALLETTLFGLPMLSVNVTPSGPGSEPAFVDPSPVEGGPGGDLGLEVASLPVTAPTGNPTPKTLNGLGADNPATWFTGTDGVAVKPMQPVLPLESLNVTPTAGGQALRGVGFRGGSYTDTTGTVPLTAAPATELRGIHAPFFTDVFFPPQPWTANYFGALGGSGNTQLHVTPVQHRSESPKMTRRKFTGMNFRLYYSNNVSSFCANRDTPAPCDTGQIAVTPALSAPPTITGVDTSYSGTTLTFSAHVLGDPVAGIQEVWVTYTEDGSGTWQSIDLVQDEDDPTLWTGTRPTPSSPGPGALAFMVQAANGVGRVTIDDNLGAYYRHGSIPGPPEPGEPAPTATTLAFTAWPQAPVNYGASFSVTVDLNAGACAANKLVRVGFGGAGLPAVTNADGIATLTLRASLTPGTYPVTATFAGDASCGSSDASKSVVVIKQPTTLTLAGTVGPAIPLVATLTANTSPPTPLHQRNVFVIIKKAGVTQVVFAGKTDPQGRVEVPQSLLAALLPGTYTVDAYFNGVTGQGALNVAQDDVDYGPSNAHLTIELWPFTGFFGLSNTALNTAKAGSSVPVKFSLGANRGLAIFALGYPKMGTINCTSGAPGSLSVAQNSGFRFDSANGHYTYDWKTEKGWRNTCRQLVLRFADGTERVLRFRFT